MRGGQRELDSNSRKPRDLVKIRHSDSLKKGLLTLSHSKVKKGDDVADDEDDDADDDSVRTSVSKDRATVTLCTGELFFRTKDSSLIRHVKRGWGEDTDSQDDTFSGPSWVSHLPTVPPCASQGFL